MASPNYVTIEMLADQADMRTLELVDELEDITLTRLLTISELAVLKATRGAHYITDEDGAAIDPDVRKAFEDAITTQALTIIQSGVVGDVLTGGATAEPTVSSTSENGASLSFDSSAADKSKALLRAHHLTTEARLTLEMAGLIGNHPAIRM